MTARGREWVGDGRIEQKKEKDSWTWTTVWLVTVGVGEEGGGRGH